MACPGALRYQLRVLRLWSGSVSQSCMFPLIWADTDTLTAQTVTMDSQTADRQTSDRRTNIDTDSQPARQTERQRETDKQTDRETDKTEQTGDRETQTDLYRGPVIVATPETSQAGEQANEEFK